MIAVVVDGQVYDVDEREAELLGAGTFGSMRSTLARDGRAKERRLRDAREKKAQRKRRKGYRDARKLARSRA